MENEAFDDGKEQNWIFFDLEEGEREERYARGAGKGTKQVRLFLIAFWGSSISKIEFGDGKG